MHKAAHLNVYWSSDFKNLYEKQTVNSTLNQLFRYFIQV